MNGSENMEYMHNGNLLSCEEKWNPESCRKGTRTGNHVKFLRNTNTTYLLPYVDPKF